MNPIESGTSSTAGFDGAAATATSAGTGVATPTTTDSATNASTATNGTSAAAATTVSPELQAVKQASQTTTTAANADQLSLMTKVVDALVSVVTTLVTLLTGLVAQLKGTNATSTNASGNGSATSGSGSSAGSGTGSTGSASNGTGGAAGTATNPGTTVVQSALDVNKNDAGMVTVRTLDGYTVRAEGRDQAWTITGPEGKTTRIWGDPHVSESDGDKWDFLNRSTFMFGKNKATVEVVPAGNGQTLSARLTIYSDRERVTIDGIDKNQPTVVAASSDGLQHDASLADGDIYKRTATATGEAWVSATTGKVVPVKK